MIPDLTPAQWFDQFPRQPQMDGHPQWCGRHWAPCPVFGANGMQASMVVMERFIDGILGPAGISPRDTAAASAKLAETGRLCCWLGDAEMYRVWGQCPPVPGGMVAHGLN